MFSLTMPMAMLILFSQVFRSVAGSPDFPVDVTYIDFLTPAMLAISTVMAGTNVGVAAAIDHTNGLHDRFATLAMPRALPAVARTINETIFTIGRAALLVGAGAALLGFRFHGDIVDAVAAVTILVALASAMSALFGAIGDRLRRPDVVQFAGMMLMMPLMFVSSAFAPLDTMPRWMQMIAAVNPVGHATDALRGHVLGTATAADTLSAVGAALVMWMLVTGVPAGFRRRELAGGQQ
jgi:ABC-2 type transport system permease protein